MKGNCVFTIVSRNYIGFAKILMESIENVTPSVKRIVVLCEKSSEPSTPNFEYLMVAELGIFDFEAMVKRYTQVELLTAIKPFAFSKLFNLGYKKVLYLDPDIWTFRSLSAAFAKLDSSDILLTPHLISPVTHNDSPTELELLGSGVYNLGFIGVSYSENSHRFIDWWKTNLASHCLIDRTKGLFLDQKWIDLVPGMFSKVEIIRDPGWNVAYWNLSERNISALDGEYYVNGEPLLFFHFSGIRPKEKVYSAHNNPFTLASLPETTRLIVDRYISCTKNTVSHYGSSNDFDFFTIEGVFIPDIAKFAYRRYLNASESAIVIDDWSVNELVTALNKPVYLNGVSYENTTVISYEVYLQSKDIQELYPNVPFKNSFEFAVWYVSTAARDFRIPDIMIDPVRESLRFNFTGINNTVNKRLYKSVANLYDRSGLLRSVVLKITSQKTRTWIKRMLLR